MEMVFENREGSWVSEFEVSGDFNLHIEGVLEGNVRVYQRSVSSGNYALVRDAMIYPSYDRVFDFDFTGLVYPKWIKVVSESEPTMAVVTFNA